MVGRKKSLLEDSLARLDAALGSPGGGVMRTPRTGRRMFTSRDGDISSIVEGTMDGQPTSFSPAVPRTSHIGLSIIDSPSMIIEDVTAPIHATMFGDTTMDATSAALLADDDPGVRATQVLFSEFVNIMVAHPSEAQVWKELEDYEQACCLQVDSLAKLIRKAPIHHANFTNTQKVYQQLLSERNTWRLLGSLYSERLGEDAESKDSPMMDEEPTTDFTVVTRLYDTNCTVREAQIVIDWLEKNAADDFESKYYDRVEYFGDTHIAWENTLKTRKNESSGIVQPLKGARPLVTSLDPDSTLRQGRPLHDLDQEDEMRLLRCVFAHVRSGQVAAAEDLCVKSGHHWRAATLEGWKLHHDPNPADPSQRQPIIGNPYRDVWKAVAWRVASDERLPAYERAVYGALCGHIQSMLSVCHEWNDILWAYTRTMVDQWVEEQLRCANTHLRPLHPLPKDFPEEKFSMKGMFEAVERHPEAQKQRNKNPYHLLQKYLILDDVETLLQEAHVWLNDGLAPHVLRCLTHLVLFLRRIGRISQQLEPLCTDILEACVKEAIERGDVEQVAWYTSVLPTWLQVEWYARFLHNITDDQSRRHALQLAATVGLDTHAITSAVVTNIRLSSNTRDPEGEVVSETTTEDRVKISAIDWLLYDPQQRVEALRQANALMRSFLVSRKIGATRVLFAKIPSDSVNVIMREHEAETGSSDLPSHAENIVREYFCIRTFLDAQDSFTDWFDHYHQKRPTAPQKPAQGSGFSQQVAYEQAEQQHKGEMERWQHTLKLITKTACDHLYNVLLFPEGGWLVDSALEDQEQEITGVSGAEESVEVRVDTPEPNRAHHLSVLRSIYIPQVTSLLQNILHSTQNYKESLQLADIIASEQHQLYKAFGSCELQRFLMKLQETSRELLDRNCDALGYPLQ
ncbi:nuclear pore complex protein Nup107 [Procambarus clarkii]|uniref:nuclear pore complex protein Nup107 n=1 Tax=Procambarus clarkii TaxID=6728 RepID=UPI001E678D89|nr:nuclear pore complex protein Nup107-like [Procambarus clarkii]XP_045609121.1 nuclear pore complex protein Nup107-like [Procambarus clarkii]XP_045609122.1 nuclear pore complex protein Nup107-like [Procambarus clarkii]